MLSYQHSYHAGNLADLHKHSILAEILSSIVQKEKSLSYIDTHSGRGIYFLDSEESKKTNEAANSIELALSKEIFPIDSCYVKVIKNTRKQFGDDAYPGSPMIAQQILHSYDNLYLMELHPKEIVYLRKNLKAPNTHIHFRCGYEGTLGIIPPKQRRGLVFIDPSYEVKNEYYEVAKFIEKIYHKWPEATIILWYPILQARNHLLTYQMLPSCNYKKAYHQTIMFPHNTQRMLGSSIFIINTPYGVVDRLHLIQDTLNKFLCNT